MKTLKNNFKNEKEIYDFWGKKEYFSADQTSSRESFSLLIPPPNLTGELHLGHAMQHSIFDAVARFKRLQGFDVLLLPGVDHAGIQFESTFEKKLSKENLSKQKLGREKWLEKAWEFKEEIYKSVSGSWRMMGLSADWEREVFTLDDGPRQAVFKAFETFFQGGLIYKGQYIVQWCPKDKTAIEDVEMEYEERHEKLYYVKYEIEESPGEYIVVATTRPETIFADVAIAVYPGHPKYKKYIGKHAINPLRKYQPAKLIFRAINKNLQIISDERVDKKFGTGAVKITPGHDTLDYKIGKDHDLPITNVVTREGRMIPFLGPLLDNIPTSEAREKVVPILESFGALEKIEEYAHSVAVCERCKSVVEPIISSEWFLRVGDMARVAIEIIKGGKINFLPKDYSKVLVDWLNNSHDWCISRSLWWGHRIPVWYKKGTPRGGYSIDSALMVKEKPPGAQTLGDIEISLESPGPEYEQDEQVLDTWFSSGLWPMSTLGWPQKTEDMERYFPWNFEISAPEIKFLWIARMIMLSVHFTGEIPFKTMFFHGMLRDLEGRKFSKSLKNGIEPTYLIEKWGVDATRMALYTYSVPGRDGRVSKAILDERGKNYRNFATKMRNIARFVSLSIKGNEVKFVGAIMPHINLRSSSKEMVWCYSLIDESNQLTKAVTNNINSLQLHLATELLYEYIWHKLADDHLETAKSMLRVGSKDAAYIRGTLLDLLQRSLILLHPFMPFTTEEIYQQMRGRFAHSKESIMIESWPTF